MTVFVSYTAVDEAWSAWIAWQLEAAGHAAVLQAWDFGPASDFVVEMHAAIERADRLVAVLSPDYVRSTFAEAEWVAAFRRDPNGVKGVLVPVRVRPMEPTGLLAGRVYVDLVGKDEATCRRLLLDALPVGSAPADAEAAPVDGTHVRYKPERAPRFPGPRPHAARDLELDVDRNEDGSYRVQALAPDGAAASATMTLPGGEVELIGQLDRIQDAVLASSAVVRRGVPRAEHPVQELGRRLFDALVVDDVRTLLASSREAAAQHGTRLRLVLRALPKELAPLPWELLFDGAEEEYVCLTTPLVRSSRVLDPRPFAVDLPLRVLGMVVSPRDQPTLEVEEEQGHLERAFADLIRSGKVELTWLGPTWRALQDAVQRGPWHVFHFVGHGGYDLGSGEGTIAVANDDARTHPLRAGDLANLLREHDPLRLVLLNACMTGRGSVDDPFSSVASVLARRGIPAVVAMQFEITEPAALEFTRSFYGALTNQLPVDLSVTQARQAIRLAIPGSLEWATPVLYLQSSDGYIFDVGDAPPIAVDEPPVPAAVDELAARYAEGLDALAGGRWDDAVALFGRIVAEDRGYRDAALRLEEAWRQDRLAGRYATALAATEAGDWQACVRELEGLHFLEPGYADVEERLEVARRALAEVERARAVAEAEGEDERERERERDRLAAEERDRLAAEERARREDALSVEEERARRRAEAEAQARARRRRAALAGSAVVVVLVAGWLLTRPDGGEWQGDDFDGAGLDTARWEEGTGRFGAVDGGVEQAGGAVHFDVSTVGVGELFIRTTCRLDGDFDVQAAYALATWPDRNRARVGIIVAPDGGEGGAVERISEPDGEFYATQIGVRVDKRATGDRSGELRLTRSGDVMSGFARSGGGDEWEQIGSQPSGAAAEPLRLQVWGEDVDHVVVAVDDLRIEAGTCS